VTLGTAAHVHYGVTIGDGAELAPDSFLMKGEEIPPYEHWGGNPAGEMRVPAAFMVRQDHDESRSIALAGTY
jgi:acetyltransferase-like isoleucine patch superfamily enzyme